MLCVICLELFQRNVNVMNCKWWLNIKDYKGLPKKRLILVLISLQCMFPKAFQFLFFSVATKHTSNTNALNIWHSYKTKQTLKWRKKHRKDWKQTMHQCAKTFVYIYHFPFSTLFIKAVHGLFMNSVYVVWTLQI